MNNVQGSGALASNPIAATKNKAKFDLSYLLNELKSLGYTEKDLSNISLMEAINIVSKGQKRSHKMDEMSYKQEKPKIVTYDQARMYFNLNKTLEETSKK